MILFNVLPNYSFQEWVRDKVTNDFENDFVIDLEPNTALPQEPFSMAASWNLDTDREDSIALNLAPMVVQAEATRLNPSDVK